MRARYGVSQIAIFMGPTWVVSAPGGPHVGPMNLAIRGHLWAPSLTYILHLLLSHYNWLCVIIIHVITNKGVPLYTLIELWNHLYWKKLFVIKSCSFLEVLLIFKSTSTTTTVQINGLVQDCSISIANALEIMQSCTKPLRYDNSKPFIVG